MLLQNVIEEFKEPFVINKILGMNLMYIKIADYINRYTFYLDKDICLALIRIKYPNTIPFVPYIKEIKNKKEKQIYVELQRYYKWSNRELQEMKTLYELMFKDPIKEEEYNEFFGIQT